MDFKLDNSLLGLAIAQGDGKGARLRLLPLAFLLIATFLLVTKPQTWNSPHPARNSQCQISEPDFDWEKLEPRPALN
jgi:hypothetical protein